MINTNKFLTLGFLLSILIINGCMNNGITPSINQSKDKKEIQDQNIKTSPTNVPAPLLPVNNKNQEVTSENSENNNSNNTSEEVKNNVTESIPTPKSIEDKEADHTNIYSSSGSGNNSTYISTNQESIPQNNVDLEIDVDLSPWKAYEEVFAEVEVNTDFE